MAWHDATPWKRRQEDDQRRLAEAEQQKHRMQMLVDVCKSWVIGDLTDSMAIRQAKQVIEGDADRVIRCE